MTGPNEIQRARVEARLARLRLTEDVTALRSRLSPSNAIDDLRQRTTEAVADARDRAVETAQRRPAAAIGVVAALGLLAAIGPLRRIAVRLGHMAWRNRAPIGRFIETKRLAKKDQRP